MENDLFKFPIPPYKSYDECYKAGFDCGLNGPNKNNCHFSFFTTHEKMKEWEKGRKEAEDGKG